MFRKANNSKTILKLKTILFSKYVNKTMLAITNLKNLMKKALLF